MKLTIDLEIDGIVDTIKSALPDMETYELTELESAINAELQGRYDASRPDTFCDCVGCRALRGEALEY